MKKIWFLMSFLACSLLLTWCDSYNNLTTYDEQTAWCEKWILSHWVEKADFERKWSEKIWDKIVITWIQYGYDWRANQEVSCEFNENGKLLWIKSSYLRNYETNNSWNVINMWENIISWWYLYRNLDLDNEWDKAEYEALQNDRNMILKYQTDTSAAVNKFIDVIHDDLLDYCQEYWTGYETMKWTMYERDVCMDNYIKDLYEKLRLNLILPQKDYSWDDPVLISYYNDLRWDHPFVRYFVDLYDILKNQSYSIAWMMPKRPNWAILSEDSEAENAADWEALEDVFLKNGTWFYTYSQWNIWKSDNDESYISWFWSWIVINWNLLERIQNEYWYNFPLGADDILYWTAPDRWGVVIHYNDWYNDYIYQIYREWGGSWEFYLLVWVLKDGLWIPIWDCWYLLYPRYPVLFWECKEWQNFDSLTVLTRGDNLYQYNNVQWMADNFRYFLRYLESIRVLSK